MRRLFFAVTVAVAVGGGSAVADMFDDWDRDRDLYIGEREWDEGFTEEGVFDEWDLDGDGVLSRTEFNSQLFRGYDVNRDRRLSLGEFHAFEEDRDDEGIFDD